MAIYHLDVDMPGLFQIGEVPSQHWSQCPARWPKPYATDNLDFATPQSFDEFYENLKEFPGGTEPRESST